MTDADPGSPATSRIGRHPGNDIIVAELGVSKRHAELRRAADGRYTIVDLGSHNRTYVNGFRGDAAERTEGDIIRIGHAAFRLSGGELCPYAGKSPGSGNDSEGPAAA